MTDRKRLIGGVVARHGIRLEEDDPAFLLVTLAELTLKDAQDQFANATRKMISEYEEAAQRVQEAAGRSFATAVRTQLDLSPQAWLDWPLSRGPDAQRSIDRIRNSLERWHLLLGAIAMFASGFAVGRLTIP